MREENYIETFDDESDFVEFLKSHGMVAKLYYEKPKTGCSIPVIDFDKPKEQPEEEKRGYYYVVEKEDKKWRMWSCENAGIVYCSRFSKRSLGMTRRSA